MFWLIVAALIVVIVLACKAADRRAERRRKALGLGLPRPVTYSSSEEFIDLVQRGSGSYHG